MPVHLRATRSEGAFDGHPDPQAFWQVFCKQLPFTETELERIAGNTAPYLGGTDTHGGDD
ncbi:hypothetical protein ACFFGH_17075 [Lysobacter korlensis]|uniref:Uncharacterized protein n=1 Tax=Lysobacter korlensis TaxID=553636 RepID=A0ABV6RRF5_9GAMM